MRCRMKSTVIYAIVLLSIFTAVPAKSAPKFMFTCNGYEIGDVSKVLEAQKSGEVERRFRDITIYSALLDMTEIDHKIFETIQNYQNLFPENAQIVDRVYKDCINISDSEIDLSPLAYHMALKPIAEKAATRRDYDSESTWIDEEIYNSIISEVPRELMVLYNNMQKLAVAKDFFQKLYFNSLLLSHEKIANHDFMGKDSKPDPLYNVMRTNILRYSKDDENYIYFGIEIDQDGIVKMNMENLKNTEAWIHAEYPRKIAKELSISEQELAAVMSGGIEGGNIFYEALEELNKQTKGLFASSGTYAEILHNCGARLNGQDIDNDNYKDFLSNMSENYDRILVLESEEIKNKIDKSRRSDMSFTQRIMESIKRLIDKIL